MTLREAAQEMLRHPLARRELLRQLANNDNTIHTAAQVLGERLVRCAGHCIAFSNGDLAINANLTDDDFLRIIGSMLRAECYLWTEHVRESLRGVKVPEHVLSPRVLPVPRLWFTFETGIQIGIEEDGIQDDIALDAVFISDCKTGIAVLPVTACMLKRPGQRVYEKHRWMVSGHLRAQWYPSEQAHHVIWIAPHLKGPDDAPLLTHAYKVAR